MKQFGLFSEMNSLIFLVLYILNLEFFKDSVCFLDFSSQLMEPALDIFLHWFF